MAIAQPFFWGAGGQKISSPEAAARSRKVAEALMNRPAADSWQSGLANVTNGIAGMLQENRVDEAEAAGREKAGGLFANLAVNADPNSIIAALTSPDSAWASPAQTSIASALLNTGLERSDPMYQLQLQTAQAELDALRNPTQENPYLNVGGGSIFNQSTGEFMTAPGSGETSLPADVQEYNWYSQGETEAGRQPLSYLDFVNAQKGGGLSVTTNPDGTTTVTQGGPGKPLTEGQSKDTVYATRAAGALPTIDQFENSLLSVGDNLAGNVPYGGFFQGEEYQLASTAGKEFLASILRKDTGAAVTPDEEQNYGAVYLPQPGDKPARIAYKKQARARALAAIEAGIPPAGILAQEAALARTGGTEPVMPANTPAAAGGYRVIGVE